ncbi:carboxylating nicotinate-nucleotide diphosphorylase [Zhihengliuella halotolerans]|uniref:Nicotinate-nucleotide pyrophosphorylase [carboxylating] n=1 Tax=Zhihengliuella halotolerans TaxID=370736 RepID=A0A4Q8ABR8_9MICC|nr:carboxylating nicotinate-nucleotide diphosphorylase [Zhihengliuella halotolerans]RZU61620.1 nicotinate-nucleotide pyrophosphorylase [carboxylating] [Zhihengliuella halotolerans]
MHQSTSQPPATSRAAAHPGPRPVPAAVVDRIVAAALAEDAPGGDITADTLIAPGTTAVGRVVAREAGVCAGLAAFAASMRLAGDGVDVTAHLADGDRFAAGDALVTVTGPARAVLTGERVGLNLLQRLSGIATATAAMVAAAGGAMSANGHPVRIADTRKTTPGLRVLERYAVRCGGGHNHRDNLSEAVMAKDNHLALLGEGAELTRELRAARERLGHTVHFEVEIDRLDQLEAVVAAGVDTVMLDNFTLEDLAEGVRRIGRRCLVEASGNVGLTTVAGIAATGVDVISSGALTHSVRALDLGLDFETANDGGAA